MANVRVHKQVMSTLFIYVDGFDLENIASLLVERFEKFAAVWGIPMTRVVNEKMEATPDWNLGLNVELEEIPRGKVEELVTFLCSLAKETSREFVVGYWDSKKKTSDDWCYIGPVPKQRDIEMLVEQLQ